MLLLELVLCYLVEVEGSVAVVITADVAVAVVLGGGVCISCGGGGGGDHDSFFSTSLQYTST